MNYGGDKAISGQSPAALPAVGCRRGIWKGGWSFLHCIVYILFSLLSSIFSCTFKEFRNDGRINASVIYNRTSKQFSSSAKSNLGNFSPLGERLFFIFIFWLFVLWLGCTMNEVRIDRNSIFLVCGFCLYFRPYFIEQWSGKRRRGKLLSWLEDKPKPRIARAPFGNTDLMDCIVMVIKLRFFFLVIKKI